jgi:hypothetical protein
MMKALFGVSLIANIILTYFLVTKSPKKEIVERVIIETHAENRNPAPVERIDTRKVVQPQVKAPDKKNEKDEAPELVVHDPVEFQDAGERMEAVRTEFLTHDLGLSEEKIQQHNKIRDEFFKKTAIFWQKNPMRELNFDERRKMIKMEEELHSKLEQLHGKENWQRYQKFRENYNQKGYKKQMEDNQPFIFMGL